jgi:pimeloyl-ACP methyl ester carboxylesterase
MLKKHTAQDLKTYDDQVMDILVGLGDGVDVVAISGGGTVASWLAQNQPEV